MSKLLRTTQPAADVTIPNGEPDPIIEGAKTEMQPPRFQPVRLNQIIRPDGTIWKPESDGCFVPTDAAEFDICCYYVEIGRLILVDTDTDTTAA